MRGLFSIFVKFLKPIRSLLFLLAYLCLKVMRPLLSVRIGWLRYDRIGHQSMNTELFLRRQTRRKDGKRTRYFFISLKPANHQLLKMIRRRLSVLVLNNKFLAQIGRFVDYIEGSDVHIVLPGNTNEYDEFNNIPPQLSFTEEEEHKGQELLKSMGIDPERPFICFHARDNAYLDGVMPDRDWHYHSFRDCDIAHYIPAAEYMVSLGIPAIRMGQVVKSPLPETHPQIIDYATHYWSDFGDIYLSAKCKFFLGNTAGLCCLPWIFDVPSAYANLPYLGFPPLLNSDIFIVKKLWHIQTKRFLTFKEMIASGMDMWLQAEKYEQAGIELIENTADEILALTKEINARIDGTWVGTDEDEERQDRYHALFPPGHWCYGFPSRIGAEYLRQNAELLD